MKEKDRSKLAIRKYVSQSEDIDSAENFILEKVSHAKFKSGINDDNEKFTYFWHSSSCFSQWYLSDFTGPGIMFAEESFLENLPAESTFNCTEQYMMYQKAMLFLDRNSAVKILYTKSPREQKQIGRLVQNFDERVWRKFRTSIVYRGNEKKFTQNETILSTLEATKGTTLVEASPYDKIWGVGLSQKDRRIRHRSTWKGLNLLGEILTALRIDLSDGEY